MARRPTEPQADAIVRLVEGRPMVSRGGLVAEPAARRVLESNWRMEGDVVQCHRAVALGPDRSRTELYRIHPDGRVEPC